VPEEDLGNIFYDMPSNSFTIADKQTVAWAKLCGFARIMLYYAASTRQYCHQLIALFGTFEHALGTEPDAVTSCVSWAPGI
jgi:hypothetical protein